jgi:hypothetical protein
VITEDDVLRAASTLEAVAALYKLSRNPSQVELSADWLRTELPHILADQITAQKEKNA